MKKILYLAAALAVGFSMASCSDDNDDRSFVTVTFENTGIELAGPTSYGANLYENYSGRKFTEGTIDLTGTVKLHFGINESLFDDEINLYNGGMALSQWNLRSNPADESNASWWYSYQNQCSVYNTASVDGANKGAGAGGSNTFVICNGYSDNNSMSSCSRMSLTGNAELYVVSLDVCNSSYTWGTMMNKNPYGSTPEQNLQEAKGWFKVEFYGYDGQGNPTNGGKPVEFYLADYRDGSATATPAISTWRAVDLSALGKVNAIEINFKGSDTGLYGLNTPAYCCIDNVTFETTPSLYTSVSK